MDLPLHDCAVLLSAIPLTATSRKDTKSNALFAKLTPSGGKSSNPTTAAANNKAFQDSLQKGMRTFVEEGNEDLVVLGQHEALFSKAALIAQPETPDRSAHMLSPEQQQGSAATAGGVGSPMSPIADEDGAFDRTDYIVDVMHLKTAKPTLLAAKRINLPSVEKRSLVAVMHEEQYVHFYSVDEASESGNNLGASSRWVKSNGVTDPFAVFHSMIRTGTFGGKTLAAIRFFCWIPEYSAVAKSQGYDGFCLIVTEGNINIVAVSTGKDQKPTTVVASVNTRCDYVEYLPRRRFLLAINSTRSSIVKCFFIDLPVVDGIRKLTELKVESDNGVVPTTTASSGSSSAVSLVGSVAPVTNAMMPHRGDRLVLPILLYDVVYICDAVPSKSELHLYVWQAPQTNSAIELANSLCKKYVLPVSDELWPLQVVTVDNLLVVQQKTQGNLCHVYDIKLLPPDQLVQEFGERAQRGRLPLAVSSIKTNIQRTRHSKRHLHQDPTTNTQNQGQPLDPEDPTGTKTAAGAVGGVIGSVVAGGRTATNQVGEWSGAAVNMASNAASAAWSALFPVSWSSSFGNTPNENGVFSVRPALIPLPVEHEHRPAGGVKSNRPTSIRSNTSNLEQPGNSFASMGGTSPPPAKGGTKASAITDLEFYRGRNLPLALNRATGEVFLVMVNPQGLASIFGDRCLGVHFLLNRTGLGGDVVPTLLREMSLRCEPLHTIGVLFGQISTQSYYYRLKQQSERQRGNMGTGSGSSGSSQFTVVAPSQRAPPKPYGKPHPRVHRKAGMDSKRLFEVFPLADVQQQSDWDFFRYEDALWYYRGPSAVGANSEAGAAAPVAAATSVTEDFVKQPSSFIVVAPEGEASLGENKSSVPTAGGGGSPNPQHNQQVSPPTSSNPSPPRPGALTAPPACFDQKQMCRFVFFPLVSYGTALQQRVNDETDPVVAASVKEEAKEFYQFFLFTLLEYCRSLRQHAQLFSHTLQSTLIDIFLVLSSLGIPQYYRLQQLLMYRGIDSHVSIALKLVRLADQYPPAFQHALDMLWRLKEYTKIVDVLVAKNLPLRAANFTWENKVRGVSVPVILLCALAVEEEGKKANEHDRSHAVYGVPAARGSPSPRMPTEAEEAMAALSLQDANHGGRGVFVTCYTLLTRYIDFILEENPGVSNTALLLPSAEEMKPFAKVLEERELVRPSVMLW